MRSGFEPIIMHHLHVLLSQCATIRMNMVVWCFSYLADLTSRMMGGPGLASNVGDRRVAFVPDVDVSAVSVVEMVTFPVESCVVITLESGCVSPPLACC